MEYIPIIGFLDVTANRVLLGFSIALIALQSIKQDFDDDANGE
jgi:hypothetical protein